MIRAERPALVERENPTLPVSQQCRLLAVSRSSVYRQPAAVSEEERTIMALIDRQYLARPYYGSRRMTAWLETQGHIVNRKRVQRLIRLMALVPPATPSRGSEPGSSLCQRLHDRRGQLSRGRSRYPQARFARKIDLDRRRGATPEPSPDCRSAFPAGATTTCANPPLWARICRRQR
jgi:putative transposase